MVSGALRSPAHEIKYKVIIQQVARSGCGYVRYKEVQGRRICTSHAAVSCIDERLHICTWKSAFATGPSCEATYLTAN